MSLHLRSDQQPCWRVRDAGSKAPVWSAMIAVSRPLSHHHPKASFVQSRKPIQTFLTQAAEYFALDSAGRPETPELQHPGPWYRDQIEHHGFGLSDNMHLRSIRLRELNPGSAGAD